MTTSNLPSTMRALLHNQAKSTLTLHETYPIPVPSEDEYLVKVSACALTTGELLWPRPPELNEFHPGVEMSGTIIQTPSSSSSKFQVGDEVYMRTMYPRAGSAREYTIAVESELALKPKNISWEEAASVPVSALTAWQGLYIHASLPHQASKDIPRPKIFINGLTTSVGLWLIQFARLSGFYIAGTGSAKNAKLVNSLGCDEFIDYHITSISNWLSGREKLDHVFDCVGLHKTPECWQAAKEENGRVWTIVLPPGEMKWPPKWEQDCPEGISETVQGRFFVMESNGKQLGGITKLIEDGKVKPVVDSVWKLEEYQKAFDRVGSGRAVGKVVIKIALEEKLTAHV